MTFLKTTLTIFTIFSLFIFFTGCSSTEQTTAKLAFQQGDFKKAEVEFEKEVKQNPHNEEAWYYLGATKIMLNKLGEADLAFQEYRKIGKNSFASEILEAWTKRWNKGADNFTAAQKAVDTKDRVKLYNDAIFEFRVALVILPDSTVCQSLINNINSKIALETVKPYIDKGVEYLGKAMFLESVNEFKKALDQKIPKENPNYYIVQYNIGVAYLKWGEDIRTTNQSTNPDDKAHLEKYKDALPYLEELTGSPDKKDQLTGWELLVQVYGNLNMTDKAMEAIKKRDELKK